MAQGGALLEVLRATAVARELARALGTPGARAELDRSGGSLQSLLLATLAAPGVRVVAVAQDDEAAHRLAADLKALLPGHPTLLFPGPEFLDGVQLPLPAHAAAYRLRALGALLEPAVEPFVVVTTPEGLCADAVAPATLSGARTVVERGRALDRDALVARLVGQGYRRGAAVTLHGEVSARGGIVDVFSPDGRLPVRLELWGDDVESIRPFDPSTQRSAGELERVVLLPPRELVPEPGLLERLARAPLDEREQELLRRLRDGDAPEGLERLLRHAGDGRATLVDYLAPGDLLAWTLPPLLTQKSHTVLDGAVQPGRLRSLLAGHASPRPPRILFMAGTQGEGEGLVAVRSGWSPVRPFGSDLVGFARWLGEQSAAGVATLVTVAKDGELQRLRELLQERGRPWRDGDGARDPATTALYQVDLHAGFELAGDRLALVAGPDLWEERALKEDGFFSVPEEQRVSFADFAELEEGCLVVHVDHGIGRYVGLKDLRIDGVRQEFLEIEYEKGDKLFVPINQLDRVQKFIGLEGGAAPRLNRLGSARWGQLKSSVKKSVEELARELLELYARREAAQGFAFGPDTVWQREMEDGFPYEETRDQLVALRDVKRDMERAQPMDRLLCGDVGYGKTEVAVRAAFKAVQDGKQAAVLVPTTVLAQQHFQTFAARLAAFPVRLAVLSRLKTAAEQKRTVAAAKAGELDVVIGTHRLLSGDVRFKDLGLLVVDEEQRFGVKHKEKIKKLKASVDVLTLSATPIPRTLNMALSGVRSISVINTPPKGRLPIRTVVQEYDDRIVAGAIRRELERGGQIYYVCNRIERQDKVVSRLKRMVPDGRVRAGHGQMDREALERLMIDFYDRAYDVLVSTTIIESGLDIPNVNTIIVEDAQALGLAQLYQLRGRVGRTTRQAYAYLLVPERRVLPELAYKRLKAIEEFCDLGSGFKIAMRDLELRGAGNILGGEQHGFVQSLGFELYTRLLRDAVAELRGKPEQVTRTPCALELQVDSLIPADYVADHELKMAYYRKFAEVVDYRGLEELLAELRDRFGPPPARVDGLARVVRLKLRATELGIASLKQRGPDVRALFEPGQEPPADLIDHLVRKLGERARFHPPPDAGFTVDLAGAKNQAVLDLFERVLWPEQRRGTPRAAL